MGLKDLTTIAIMQQFYRWGEFYAITKGDFDGGDGVQIVFLPQHLHLTVRSPGNAEQEWTMQIESVIKGLKWAQEQ